jgi:wyosine [tRNA(Phe)-imidazoG37] synthetase (radical SAM superfamily)
LKGDVGRNREMIYALQTSCTYGPVNSRRLGRSLGVNVLPSEVKLCPFDCVYCHYGDTDEKEISGAKSNFTFPPVSEVVKELEEVLERLLTDNDVPDYITFSGNGEPTTHPEFGLIVDEVKSLRDRYVPKVPVAILSNSTTVHRPLIREALMKLDRRIMKLDAGNEEIFQAVNRPHPSVTLEGVIEGLRQLQGITVQTAFMTGSVDNTKPDQVEDWIVAIDRIRPEEIQIYTIDRPSADGLLKRVDRSVLDHIARKVTDQTGVPAAVFYNE